ncbi:unnamed protein product [Clonostachys rosea f. rosea IK726]|uniref:Potassium channel domain-containing protein n=2 Tax=Bionectria ochroleuca TaxID=29856 RepID=A0A0B7KQA0_BIOOC|nr:unnamed protein product [Clonostachys rosea f. rosea IK726]
MTIHIWNQGRSHKCLENAPTFCSASNGSDILTGQPGSRWWFLSMLFPMMAGTLGPVASAFSICAMSQPWRQLLGPGGNIQTAPTVPNPSWLKIVNAVQLAIAVVSNFVLFLNMARRVRFSIAQPITIVGWYISAILRIVMGATAAGPLLEGLNFPKSELIWSQAFWYGIWAAFLYFIDATLMTLTFWGASSGHYGKEFTLTYNQRTLMLQTIIFLFYLLCGARVYSAVEGWEYLDAVYWADVTMFTAGFGDYAPNSTLGRALLIPYVIFGIISLGLVIDSIRKLFLDRGTRRFVIRTEERARRKLVGTMLRRHNDELLHPISAESQPTGAKSDQALASEFARRKAEFNLMRKIQKKAFTRRRWMVMTTSTTLWLALWLIGAFIFMEAEAPYQGWTYFDSFYFSFVSWTTIGYGDLTPVSNAGKSFFVFWSLLALPTITMLISHAGDTVVKIIRYGSLRLGNITILPGDESFIGNLKHIISLSTFGWIFPDHFDSASPEFTSSESFSKQRLDDFMSKHEAELSDTATASHAVSHRKASRRHHKRHADAPPDHKHARFRNAHDELPTGTNFHFLLISEIQVIASHLKESTPHRYTFEEWAWYLRLLGEDERKPGTHCKATLPIKKCESQGEGLDQQKLVWSWVGDRNPLLSLQIESEWIFDRLTERLRESLLAERRGQLLSDTGDGSA